MKTVTILLADDDADDRAFAIEACRECRFTNDITGVADGEELMEYLRRTGRYSARTDRRNPSLILLDLRMPRMDGFEVLKALKADPKLQSIPVVVLTTSEAEEDIVRSYSLGVNSFITKPVTFAGLVQAVRTLGQYWFELVELPTKREPEPQLPATPG
jgi:two-component system response regulator